MRSEEQGSVAAAEDFGFEEAAKFRGSDGVQAASGFVEQKYVRLVEQGASETQTLDRSRGERAELAVECFSEMELFREQRDTLRRGGVRKMIEAPEEAQILAAGESRVKAEVTAGMIADLAADGARVENGIVSGDLRMAMRGKKQRGENFEEGRFSRAVCTQERQRFAGANLEGNSGERDHGRFFKWLQESAPAAARGRKQFFEGCNSNRGFRHDKTYSVSVARRQSVARNGQVGVVRRILCREGRKGGNGRGRTKKCDGRIYPHRG